MNSDTNFDYITYHERDEQSFGYFTLGRKRINTEIVTYDNIIKKLYNYCDLEFENIDGDFLNNTLRSGSVDKLYLTVTEPIFICVKFTNFSKRDKEFYRISFGNFLYFQQNFCDNLESCFEEKNDWSKNGF